MGSEGGTSVAFFVSARQLNWKPWTDQTLHIARVQTTAITCQPPAPAGDLAATVLVEAPAAEPVLAVRDSQASGFPLKLLLLERFSIHLINTNEAADKIPILLIRKNAIARRPGKIARRLWMIGIVHEIVINPGIRR